MGLESPRKGIAHFGSSNVIPHYYTQNQADALCLDVTVMEYLKSCAPDISVLDVRNLLAQFMFKDDHVEKQVKLLSGGEKARLALCTMLLTPSNLLILDEPTNHLDIVAREVLEDALAHFEGTVVIVSHDRFFMSQLAHKIFEFKNEKILVHDCSYLEFMTKESSDLKEKVVARYVEGDYHNRIKKPRDLAKVIAPKKNFCGSGTPCGNKNKGIKNAKRFQQ